MVAIGAQGTCGARLMRPRPIYAVGLLLAMAVAGCQAAPGHSGAAPPHDTLSHDAPLGVATPRDRALKGQLYLLPPGSDRLPDFRRLKPVGALYVRSLDIPDQDLQAVFPDGARRNQPFAVDYRAAFSVHTAGAYRFRLLSDDGSRVVVDGRTLIESTGAQPGEAALPLAAGRHQIVVQVFQDPRSRIALQLGCQAPGGPMTPFPGCGLTLASTSLWRVWLMWVAVLASLGAWVIWQTRRRIARESRGLR